IAEKGARGKNTLPPTSGGAVPSPLGPPRGKFRARARLLPPRHGQAEDVPAVRGRRRLGPEAPPPAGSAGQARPPRQAPREAASDRGRLQLRRGPLDEDP